MAALALPQIDIANDLISGQIVTPLDMLQAVAPLRKHTHLLWKFGRKDADPKGKAREWFPLNEKNTVGHLTQCVGEDDIYYTPNEFYGWRQGRLLTALNAFYIDIDVHGTEGGCPIKATLDALDKISAAHLPDPNLVVYTGRGAHIYWLFDRTPSKALPRWQAVQRALVNIAGGDRNVIDCTRVLRMPGTVNSKAPLQRKTVTVEVKNRQRYEFDWLCDQIILPRAEIRDIRAARVARGQKPFKATGRNFNSIGAVWAARLQDMLKIIRVHWRGSIVEQGERNNMLYYVAVALSWIVEPEALRTELGKIAAQLMPSLSDADIDNCVLSVLDRAIKAGEGKKIEGMDPRYRFRSETLWEAFQSIILKHPQLVPELKSILPPGERKARNVEREKARDRVKEGRYQQTRSEYLQGKTRRMQQALQLWMDGSSTAQIAAAVGATSRTIQSYIKSFKASQISAKAPGENSPPLVSSPEPQNRFRAVFAEVEAKALSLLKKAATAAEIALHLGIPLERAQQVIHRLQELRLTVPTKAPPGLNVAQA